MSGADREKLAALGYLGGAVAASGPLPDPRERIHVLKDVRAAFRLAAAGRDEDAVRALRDVLGANPLLLDARYELARVLTRLGRWEDAYVAYRTALRTAPSLAGPIALDLGRVCLRLGRLEEAEANGRLAASANPPAAHEVLARVALARGDLDGALREAGRATGDPGAELGAAVVRAEVQVRRGRFEEAAATIDAALRGPAQGGPAPIPDLHFLRGDALARLGRHGEAEAAFAEEIRLFPGNAPAYARLAIVYGLQRRPVGEVDRLLERMVKAAPGPDTVELAAKTLESMGDPRGARAWRDRAGRGPR